MRALGWLVLGVLVAAVAAAGCGDDADDGGDDARSWLFVMQATLGAADDGTLTLGPVTQPLIAFEERPGRTTRPLLLTDLVQVWDESFADDPPNASISGVGGTGDGAELFDAVVALADPVVEGNGVTFSYVLDDGSAGMPETFGLVTMVIDGTPHQVDPAITDLVSGDAGPIADYSVDTASTGAATSEFRAVGNLPQGLAAHPAVVGRAPGDRIDAASLHRGGASVRAHIGTVTLPRVPRGTVASRLPRA